MNKVADLQVGEAFKRITLPPVTKLDLIKYAGASGDYNPIHTIDDEAKRAGLPGIIAHGMWTMGNLAKFFTPYYEEMFIQDYSIRFKAMVLINDVITLHAVVEEDNGKNITVNVKATNQDEREVITGYVVLCKY